MPRRAKKPVAKKPELEPKFPNEVYAYFVKTTYEYGYRRTTRTELRVVTDVKKVPGKKQVAIFKKTGLGQVERKVDFTLRKTVK